jgi:hypothetical protein
MLSPAAASRANAAIDAARSAARAIVKAGETAAVEVDAKAVELIRTSRMAFLDLDDGDTVEVQAPVSTAAAIDFEIDLPAPEPIAPAVSVFDLDVA